MPSFRRVKFVASNAAGAIDEFCVSVEITSGGVFYAHVPDKLKVAFSEDHIDRLPRMRRRKDFFVASALTFDELFRAIEKAHKEFMTPSIKVEPVIRFNIESHVSFALTEDGRIFPNAGYPGAEWPKTGDKTYGDHNALQVTDGGYSLTVGAKAMLKTTTTYGDKHCDSYSYYYGKENDHFSQDDPAAMLNSWCSIKLPEDAREIPYSDEAAMFFFGLLQSMAELNRRVQDFTKTPEKLARSISRSSGALMLAAPVAAPPDAGKEK